MKVTNKPDNVVDDATCKAATGKTLGEWFRELDAIDGLKKGRRECTQHVNTSTKDAWWPTTIAVAYENHHKVLKKDGLSEGFTICVTKTIGAPVETTYAAWVDKNRFAEFFGDNGRQDVREGGMLTCDGGCKGSFSRVRANKDLRFSWEHPGCTAPMTVDVQFQDIKGKTLMNVMTSRIQTRAEADGLRDAWSAALTKLKSIAER